MGTDEDRERSRTKSKHRKEKEEGHSDRKSKHRHHRSSKSKEKSRARSKEYEKKKHKSRKQNRSSSSDRGHRSTSSESSSSDSTSPAVAAANAELQLLQRLEEERRRVKEEQRRKKERMKAMETPEQKRIRRLLKKEAKERKRKEQMGWDTDYLHYTNADNPFGDNNLLQSFVWGKKLEKEGLSLDSISHEELEKRNRQKMEENKQELEKVKLRRIAMEAEKAAREDEASLVQRQREAAQFKAWEQQEDEFHLNQARLRSKIRIQDGRAKPIDLLAKYVSSEEDMDAVEMHEPYIYLTGLGISDLEDLIEDIKVYKELERGNNLDFWTDMTIIVVDELLKLQKLEAQSKGDLLGERREGIHQAVSGDVANVFKGKTPAQLEALKAQITAKVHGNEEGVDVAYWESLLSQLNAFMARARLRERHQANLKKKLELMKAEQGVKEHESDKDDETARGPLFPIKQEGEIDLSVTSTPENPQAEGSSRAAEEEEIEEERADFQAPDVDVISKAISEYESGRYSPKLLQMEDLEPGTLVVTEEDDERKLAFDRQRVLHTGDKIVNVMTAEEQALQREARKGMTDDEAVFSVEADVDSQAYLWSDKYRPRKPRYFNRVHTGFEWNKYNQTHYDMDNPPPKIVQGYKFNIFYPDLIDKKITPSYQVIPCRENPDFAILHFKAGPPYEDIAFKIVNREWELSYRRGFRCQFHNNIFQLWFHFKRYRYRR